MPTLVCLPPYFWLSEGSKMKWNFRFSFISYRRVQTNLTHRCCFQFPFINEDLITKIFVHGYTFKKIEQLRLKPKHFSYMLPMHIQDSSWAWNSFSLRSLLIPVNSKNVPMPHSWFKVLYIVYFNSLAIFFKFFMFLLIILSY